MDKSCNNCFHKANLSYQEPCDRCIGTGHSKWVPSASILQAKKPPLGVMPRKFWLEARCQDLARAIHEYTAAGKIDVVVQGWAQELIETIALLERRTSL